MTRSITRRDFIKTAGAALAALTVSPTWGARAGHPLPPEDGWDPDTPVRMGRGIHASTIYDAPAGGANRIGTLQHNQMCFIRQEIRAPGLNAHNDLWYESDQGYIFSAWVQPMWIYPRQPVHRHFPEWGLWGEVWRPWTDARSAPHPQASSPYRFYGGTTYHVVDVTQDEFGNWWYKIFDELPPTDYQWVLAHDIRRIGRDEVAPIHPFVGNKRIEVSLARQEIVCYEGDQVVFTTKCAGGVGIGRAEDGSEIDLSTPTGKTHVLLKQVSRHMSNRPLPGEPPPPVDIFDLPGIPWNTFFDLSGTAIHGTYWHNDFGVRRSHGCLNVSCDVAHWIYRWTHPIGAYEDDFIASDGRVGTPISIY